MGIFELLFLMEEANLTMFPFLGQMWMANSLVLFVLSWTLYYIFIIRIIFHIIAGFQGR